MLKPCPHRHGRGNFDVPVLYINEAIVCKIASELAMLYATPTKEQCKACTEHPTLPQRINGIVCAVAKKAQMSAGLEVDPKLINCIHTEQTLEPEVLVFLQNKWKQLHSYKLANWNPTLAKIEFEKWKEDIPQFGCVSCASHFEELIEEFPPIFTSQKLYFGWTVLIHNKVNLRLYKDEFSIQKAMELYGYL